MTKKVIKTGSPISDNWCLHKTRFTKEVFDFTNHCFADMCPTQTSSNAHQNEDSDTSCDSDNSMAPYGSSFFEGVEKLLEVWFTTMDGEIDNCDLRRIPR